ncbi:Metapyrocatechase 2 [Penicillium rolfsii]|nr:Metapyrocatechase 2 [Penicillium rolfsii]
MTPPNHGASVLDVVAIGNEQEDVAKWQQRCHIDKRSQIRLVKLAHMRYQHPDLEQITTFLEGKLTVHFGFLRIVATANLDADFGMAVAKRTEDQIWYRGYGSDQYVYYARKGPKKFLGGTFTVESYEELEKAAKLPTASNILDLSDAPGGGWIVTLTDPEGFPVNLIFGQTPAAKGPIPEKLIVNYEEEKPRIRRFQRFQPGPAAVHKLGHCGVCTQIFDDLVYFYTSTFNLVPTDFLYIEEEGRKKNVALFAHIDRGDQYVDHHSFFRSANTTTHVHHCSFEVHDFDTQKLGHQWLAMKNYKSVWGVGRHILGSQIFDYWWDTTGNMIEHYADGDLVNDQTPVGYGPAGDESLAVWGPDVPAWFLK